MQYTILILLKALPAWLAMSREERNGFTEKTLVPIFEKYAEALHISYHDSEAFHAEISDFMIIKTTDMKSYYFFIEELRDTPVFARPYFELKDLIMGLEDGYKKFEAHENQK